MIQLGDPTLPDSPVGLADPPLGQLLIRLHGTSHEDQVVSLHSPKCTIGSDRRCTLRLDLPGIRPVHCLIIRGCQTTVVRRWSPDTRLNGASFSDAQLVPGDRLGIGPIEMEIVEANPLPAPPQSPKSRKPQEIDESPRLRSATGRLNLANRQARHRARRLVEELRAARAEIGRLLTEALQTSSQTDQNRSSLDIRQEQLRRQADLLEAQQAEFEAQRREQLRQQTERFETENRELEAHRNQLRQQAEQLEARRTELDAQREQLRQQADQIEAQRASIEQDRALWNRQQADQHAALAEHQAQLVSHEAQRSAERGEQEQQRHQLEAQRVVLEENQRRHDQREAQLEEDRRQIEACRAELDVRQSEFEQRQQQWTQECRDRDEAWQAEHPSVAPLPATGTDASHDAQQAELQAQRDAFERERQQWEAEVESHRREWDRQQAEFEQRQQEFQLMRDRSAAKNKEIEARLTDWQLELDTQEAKLEKQRRAREEHQTSWPVARPEPASDEAERTGEPAEMVPHDAPAGLASVLPKVLSPLPASDEKSPSETPPQEGRDAAPASPRATRPLQGEAAAEASEETAEEREERERQESRDENQPEKAHEDDRSIDDYMARLLQRLGSMTGATPASQGGRPTVTVEPAAPSRQAFLSADHPYRQKAEDTEQASEEEKETAERRTTARRRSALEGIGSLAAMRELATATASSALTAHARSQLKKMSLGKLFLAVASLALGLALIIGWLVWGFRSWQFYVGVAGLFLALLWVIQYAVLVGRLTLTRNGHLSWGHPTKPAAPQTPSAEELPSTSDAAAPEVTAQASPTTDEQGEDSPAATY